jgi:hypothetical protein
MRAVEQRADEGDSASIDAWRFALPGAADREREIGAECGALRAQPCRRAVARRCAEIGDEQRLAVVRRLFARERRTARDAKPSTSSRIRQASASRTFHSVALRGIGEPEKIRFANEMTMDEAWRLCVPKRYDDRRI